MYNCFITFQISSWSYKKTSLWIFWERDQKPEAEEGRWPSFPCLAKPCVAGHTRPLVSTQMASNRCPSPVCNCGLRGFWRLETVSGLHRWKAAGLSLLSRAPLSASRLPASSPTSLPPATEIPFLIAYKMLQAPLFPSSEDSQMWLMFGPAHLPMTLILAPVMSNLLATLLFCTIFWKLFS